MTGALGATRFLLLAGLLAAAAFRQESPAPLGEVLDLTAAGSYEAARERLSTAGDRNPHVLRLRLELAARGGDEEGVRRLAGRLLDLYDTGALRSPGEVAEAAYAARQLEQWKRANQLYLEAARGAGAPLWLYVDWGNLYLEKHNGAEAESIFRDGLKASPQDGWSRWGTDDARLGLARALKAQQMAGVDVALDHVLKENPRQPGRARPQRAVGHGGRRLERSPGLDRKGTRREPQLRPPAGTRLRPASFPGAAGAFRGTPAEPPGDQSPKREPVPDHGRFCRPPAPHGRSHRILPRGRAEESRRMAGPRPLWGSIC